MRSTARMSQALMLLCVTMASAVASAQQGVPLESQRPPARPITDASLSPLTLGECVRRALANGFDMEIQQYDVVIAHNDIPISRSEFLPTFTATTGKNVTRSPADTLQPALRSESIGATFGLSQRLRSGTTVSIESNQNRFESTRTFAAFNPAYASDFTLALSQSLFKGFGSRVNTLALRRAEIGVDVAERSFEDRALDVIQATENAYYILTGARDQLSVFQTSLQLAQALEDEAESRRSAGMATRIDVLQAQVGVANARLNVLEGEKTVRASEDALLALIGRFELDTSLGPTVVDDVLPGTPPTVESSYKLALGYQPALLNARAGLEVARLDLEFAEDDLKPAVDLDLALGFNGSDRTGGRAWSDTFEQDRSSWQAGLTVIYPLGRVAEKARFSQSRAALNREELRIRQLEQDILLQVREAVRDVETSRESVQIAALAVDLSERQYEAERERFTSGLSTGRRVLESQTDLESARLAELQARLNLRTAMTALRRIEGSSLRHYGITLTPSKSGPK